MHAYLPPRVQLGQSGRESSGVERAHRGPGPGADCSAALIYSWRTMMAAWVSTDGGALAAPAHTHLASNSRHARLSEHVGAQPPKHTFVLVANVPG